MALYIIFVMTILTHTGFAGSRLAVPLFAVDRGATPFVVGTVVALYAVFPTVLALPAGRMADRLGFRWPLLFGTGTVCVALVLPGVWPSMPVLYFTASLLGIGFMAFQLASQTLAGAIAAPEDRARSFALVSLGFAIGNFVGPLVAGFLIDHTGYTGAFLVLALPLVPAIILAWRSPRWLPAVQVRSAAASGGVLDLLKIKPLRDTLIASGIVSTAWDVYQFFMPIYGRALDLSATAIGSIMSAFAISIILVRVFLPLVVKRFGEIQLLTYAMFIACVAFCLFPLFKGAWTLAAISFLLGVACGLGQPLSMTLVFNTSPKGRVGEATGLRITVNQVTHVVVPLLFGAVGSAVGFMAVFLSNAAFLMAGGYMSLRNHPKREESKP